MQHDNFIKRVVYKALQLIPDSVYVRLKYRKAFGRWPDLRNPRSFNEKLTWLKLHDRNPLYTAMVDKYEAKRYVAGIIGDEYIIPTYGVWDRAEDIDFDALPDKFVLKATHDSGRVIICRDKSTLDRQKAIREMRLSLRRNFYAVTREWPYKNVKPRIIAEKLLEVADNAELADYKVHNFNGVPKVILVVETDSEILGSPKIFSTRNGSTLMYVVQDIPMRLYWKTSPKNWTRCLNFQKGFQNHILLCERISTVLAGRCISVKLRCIRHLPLFRLSLNHSMIY